MIQRESFSYGAYRIDCSRVRMNFTAKPIKEMKFEKDSSSSEDSSRSFRVKESGVLDAPIIYEIEIELIPEKAKDYAGVTDETHLLSLYRILVRFLRLARNDWFLTDQRYQYDVLREYTENVLSLEPPESLSEFSKIPFIGPMPVTLEKRFLHMIQTPNTYTVTAKADGERTLLRVSKDGLVSLIYRTLQVENTGIRIDKTAGESAKILDSLLDGEIIRVDSLGRRLAAPIFLIFDCYRYGGKNIIEYPFMVLEKEKEKKPKITGEAESKEEPEPEEEVLEMESYIEGAEADTEEIGRKDYCDMFVLQMEQFATEDKKLLIEWKDTTHRMLFMKKSFYILGKTPEEWREAIMNALDESSFKTDGIIFTPVEDSVKGSHKLMDIRGTWGAVMKWKPPQDNTVDFLLEIQPEIQEGSGLRYLKGDLYVIGSLLTPERMFEYQKDYSKYENERNQKIVPFQSGVSHIILPLEPGQEITLSKSGEIIANGQIVECYWNPEKPNPESMGEEVRGGWVVRNIRWDKTAVFQSGEYAGTMNGEKTALSVYQVAAIQPVNKSDLWTIPVGGRPVEELYFNREGSRSQSLLVNMVDFHNLVVKNQLLNPGVEYTRDKLIVDIACGKGGDIPRFQRTRARMVLGTDLNRDNIVNPEDGAIRRFLDEQLRKEDTLWKNAIVPMKFAVIDGTADLRSVASTRVRRSAATVASGTTTGGLDPESVEVIREMFNERGLMYSGVDIVSCMFAIHYFFENEAKAKKFFSSVSNMLKTGGRFVACTFDSEAVVRLLGSSSKYIETVPVRSGSRKGKMKTAWSIQENYDKKKLRRNPETKLLEGTGHSIDVYIETINETHTEYLVHFPTLLKIAETYGNLRLATPEEAKEMGYPSPTESFAETFHREKESRRMPGKAALMRDYEKKLSFLYRWFILVKQETRVGSSSA
jgi:SAM-dependent methyltransferase